MNKLEEHIKEKLTERRIDPSHNAWERVAADLSEPAKKTNGNRFWYYAIAASFIGLLALGVFYRPFNEVHPSVKVSTTIEDKKITSPVPAPIKTTELSRHETVVEKIEEPPIDLPQEPVVAARKNTGNHTILEDYPTLEQVAIEDVNSKEDVLIAEKLDAVLAQVSQLEADNTLVTDAEVDSLLRIAQREILTDSLWQQAGKVDAMALLNEVEGELDKTFRDQLFEKLKDGFFKVRTAVADRNN